jgi:hypothetical protein
MLMGQECRDAASNPVEVALHGVGLLHQVRALQGVRLLDAREVKASRLIRITRLTFSDSSRTVVPGSWDCYLWPGNLWNGSSPNRLSIQD